LFIGSREQYAVIAGPQKYKEIKTIIPTTKNTHMLDDVLALKCKI
jgi:hypothetical protein